MLAGVPDLVAAAAQPKGNHGRLRDGDGGSMLFYPQTQTAGPAAARHALACPSTQRGAGRAGVTVAASDRRSSSSFKVGPRRRRRSGTSSSAELDPDKRCNGPGRPPHCAALRCDERLCPRAPAVILCSSVLDFSSVCGMAPPRSRAQKRTRSKRSARLQATHYTMILLHTRVMRQTKARSFNWRSLLRV